MLFHVLLDFQGFPRADEGSDVGFVQTLNEDALGNGLGGRGKEMPTRPDIPERGRAGNPAGDQAD